ncbi:MULTISPECIES: DUF4166 domain-containing protein [Pseudoalteromonas]|uniref:DUF4166 domain-containing protein n=1 Tax=Pseudoalteromonas spongiae TaxID=298657 RepID=A0ABU8ERQ5_9GAMM|nr:DUF4166 domain-containing protein [Pseudoalteromonas sp. P1-9]KPV94632.1 hypothetical protein AN214_03349 [Pseudoalteromonas sp. P1-9]
MSYEVVSNWFEEEFTNLDPLLQKLHLFGGELSGNVEISYGRGVSGLIGKRLARKMKLPSQGIHDLVVSIKHSESGLHWDRKFNNNTTVESLFVPVGNKKNGFWIETTGPLKMKLTVDIIDNGWFWRCLNVSAFGLPIPLCLIPKCKAYKLIKDEKYIFSVSFSYPFLGNLVSYSGKLNAKYYEYQD